MTEPLIYSALWCLGVYCVLSPNYLLGWLGDSMREVLPRWMAKPMFDCLPCMASIHGTLIHFISGGDVFTWIPFVICLSGLNYFLTMFFTE